MGICSDECNCHVEGERGLRSDGTGTAPDPFTPQPDSGRTMPRTVDTFGSLPAVDPIEVGQVGWVVDENGLRVQGTDRWEEVAPPWRQVYPDTTDLLEFVDVWATLLGNIGLTPGFWFLKANGILQGTADPPVSSGPGVLDIFRGVIEIRFGDVTANEFYDTSQIDVETWTLQESGGGATFFKETEVRRGFDLQNIMQVPEGETRTVNIQVRQTEGAFADFQIVSADLCAVQVQRYDFNS